MFARSAIPSALFVAVLVASGSVAASGPRSGMSNEATLTGGAVLAADTDEPATLWYNPAALALIKTAEAEVNAETYALRWTSIPRGVEVDDGSGPTGSAPAQSTDFLIVPTTFVGALPLHPNWVLGFGLFTPQQSSVDLRSSFRTPASAASDVRSRTQHALTRYEGVLGIGWRIHEAFEVGASVSLIYDDARSTQRVLLRAADPRMSSSFVQTERVQTSAAMSAKLGVRGRLGRRVHGAATVQIPRYLVYRDIAQSDVMAQNVGGDATIAWTDARSARSPGALVGWGVAAGISFDPGRMSVRADVHATAPPPRGSSYYTRNATWGAQAGVRGEVTDRISLGGGVYGERTHDTVQLGSSMTWGGASFGVQLRRRLGLQRRGKPRTLEFRTMFGLRYAYGRGTVPGLRVIAVDAESVRLEQRSTPATSNLLAFQVGSGVAF